MSDIDDRERAGEILVYRRTERKPHRILRSRDGGVTWKSITGEFWSLEEALDTIKRLHKHLEHDPYEWCAERIATGERTGLIFDDDEDPPPSGVDATQHSPLD